MLRILLAALLLSVTSCGTEGDYQVYGIEVFESPYGPGKEHLKEGIDFFAFTFADFLNISVEKMYRKIENIDSIRFDDETRIRKTVCGGLINAGLYYPSSNSIFVWWGPLDNCVGRSALFHEIYHRCTEENVRNAGVEVHTREMLDALDLAENTFSMIHCEPRLTLTEEQAEGCRRDPNEDGVEN